MVTYGEADALVSGAESEDLDVYLLVAARSGDIDAIASVCGHYRGRLMILAGNAGAAEPDLVVQQALTDALLQVEAVESPSLADFERNLFNRVVADSEPASGEMLRPEPPLAAPEPMPEPAPPTHPDEAGGLFPELFESDTLHTDVGPGLWADDPADGAPVAGLAALTAPDGGLEIDAGFGEQSAMGLGSAAEIAPEYEPVGETPLLNPNTGPVDWSALAAEQASVGPVLVAPSNRVLAGGAAVVCGIGVLAAIALFFGGGDSVENAEEPQLAALVPGEVEGSTPESGPGPEPASPEAGEQSRSSGTVTDNPTAPSLSITIEPAPETSTTVSSSTSASSTVTIAVSTTTVTTTPPSTAPPTTPSPTTTVLTTVTTRPQLTTTIGEPGPGNFTDQTIDNQAFRQGDFRDHSFTGARLNNTDFQGADLRGVSFAGVTLRNVRFINSDLTGADFSGADMDNTSFDGRTNISLVDFRNSFLKNGTIASFWTPGNPPLTLPNGEFDFGDD